MFAYLVRRVLAMVPTLLVISAIIFLVIRLPGGDYLTNEIATLEIEGDTAAVAKIQFLRHEYGLDRPVLEQYASWLGVWPGPNGLSGLLQGNLGWSFEYDRPVSAVIGTRALFSILLNVAAVLFTWIVAFPIGVYSATRQYSLGDYGFTFLGYLGLAIPNFLLALVMLFLANRWFGLSIGGLMEPRYVNAAWSFDKVRSVGEHLIIPTIIIGAEGTAGMIRRLRANLLDELQKQYVVTGRAKGLPPLRLLLKYPIRMALNPFVADIGNMLPKLVSGAAIVSVVLSLPTMGPLLLHALQNQDQFLAGSMLLILATLTVVGMFLSDILLAILDPRIRFGGGIAR
jgi:peptide/nickel transport system permease protein